jgi:protein O-mannosyl-transferase
MSTAASRSVAVSRTPGRYDRTLLLAAFLLPNIGALACGFVFDDLLQIVYNARVHSLTHLREIWTSNVPLPTLYRPLTVTLWASLWTLGEGSPLLFHAVGLALGAAVVTLFHRLLLVLETAPQIAFIAAMLFALFPIHTEATTSVVGSGEVLAALFAIASLIFYEQRQRVVALAFFALAALSKESSVAIAALPVVFASTDPGRRRRLCAADALAAGAAAAIVVGVLLARQVSATGPAFIPPIDNPTVTAGLFRRILTALWVQCLYIFKTIVPLRLSADYSYNQIPVVISLDDPRAWAGLGLVALVAVLAVRRAELRRGLLLYVVLFSPTANLLFPIGTVMGERLAYLPTASVALVGAILLARSQRWRAILVAVAVLYGLRTVVRNRDWRNADAFYASLVRTSPQSAKAHYAYGLFRAGRDDDPGAVAAYDQALSILPAYPSVYLNRGNALARLGRRAEAMSSYRNCLRFDPGNGIAANSLQQLERGQPLYPPRRPL